MTTRPGKRRPAPRTLPSSPAALFIGDESEAEVIEPILLAGRLRVNWKLTGNGQFDLEEFLLDIEEGFEGQLAGTAVAIVAADRLVDARLDIINLIDELLEPRRPILVSCTQATVTEQAMLCQHPERIAGFGIIGLLGGAKVTEITPSLRTAQRYVDQALSMFRQQGMTAHIVGDTPGQAIARMLAPVVNEAARALGENAAAAGDIDEALRLAGYLPFGPLAWADTVGLDRIVMVLEHLAQSIDAERYRPAALLRQLALSGFVGRSAGRGFFTYDDPAAGR